MTRREFTRRSVVRRSLATVSLGTVVGMAGCSAVTDRLGGTPTATAEPEPAPERVYADWLPAPDDLGDTDHYQFNYFDLDDYESNEDELDDESDPSSFEDVWSPLEFDWEDASHITAFGSFFGLESIAIEADFDRDDAISTLEDEDFSEDSEYSGYTLMLSDNEQRVYAVRDGVLVLTSATGRSDSGTPSTGETSKVESILDARNGDAERYDEASDDMSTLTEALGSGSIVNGRTTEQPDEASPENGQFEAMVAQGSRSQIDGDTTTRKWVIVYESSDDVDTDDLETWVTENSSTDDEFADADDIAYSADGRMGVITATVDTDDL